MIHDPIETVQIVTLIGWQQLCNYGTDNRVLLKRFRRWAADFDAWWLSLPDDDRNFKLDYETQVLSFTQNKINRYKDEKTI